MKDRNVDDDYIAAEEDRLIEKEKVKEYSKRVSEKDKLKNNNYATRQSDERRLATQASAFQDNDLVTENLREKSRQDYLLKRRHDKIEDLREELREEELYFKNDELSQTEIERNETKQMIYKVARMQEKSTKQMNENYYNIPSNESTIVMNTAEVEKRPKRGGLNEWEDRQLKSAMYQKQKTCDQEYEILIDNFVDFDQAECLAAENIEELPSAANSEESKQRELSIGEVRQQLPIYKYKEELLERITDNRIVIVEGETGSGKTTQIPQYLLEAGYCGNDRVIGCTQPRRVAAMSVAARVATEMNAKLGDRVGYSVRFETRVSDQTQIKYLTDGMLLREFLIDPRMSKYSVLIIDEAHERTLQTDLLFGLLKVVKEHRPDLKIVISSATCDLEKFATFFDAPVMKIPGRRFPVETYYIAEQVADYVAAAVDTVLRIHVTQPDGDVLVFLTGQDDIEAALDALAERTEALANRIRELIVLPIYSALPVEKQSRIFCPTAAGARKVVLATNIAETSLTIDGIKYVIDCGYCKRKTFDPRTRMDSLKIEPITRASAIQRSGRAGRVAPGKCYRLYKKCTFDEEFEEQVVPEIQRTNLGNVVLLLKSLGCADITEFEFMDVPSPHSLLASIEELYRLGAINHRGEVTLIGRKMVEIPCDPMISNMILRSENYGCSEEIITIAAMLSLDNTIFYTPKNKKLFASQAHQSFMQEEGDHLTLLSVYNQYSQSDFSSDWCHDNYIQSRSMKIARNIREQLIALTDRLEVKLVSNPNDKPNICKAITAAFFLNTARFRGDCYKTIKLKDSVYMPRNCVFQITEDFPRYVVFNNIVHTSKQYMRVCTKIDPRWLIEVAPHVYKDEDFDGDRQYKKMSLSKRKR